MAAQGVKLLGAWASPYSRRVEIALKLKGIDYEFVAQTLSPKSPDVLKYNPVHKKVPILLHNGKPVVESLVVVEYIDETWSSGPSILPADPLGKANARFWAKFIDDKLMPAIINIRRCQGEEQVKAIDVVVELLKVLENELKGKKFFGGDTIGLVDIAANFIALWLPVHQEIMGLQIVTKEKLPVFCAWIDEYLNSSIIKQSLPSKDELSTALLAYHRS
ncbi:Glutathione transferase [Heracleum sosnowskyi]|uniref:glutathione transferase n=1 Tax=Heracleum sosnowskyi TaxID=360622 RepID=A0AAD8IR99_9APIA|nr:Glutathione transferase [Heracleum sosnowskyi]